MRGFITLSSVLMMELGGLHILKYRDVGFVDICEGFWDDILA